LTDPVLQIGGDVAELAITLRVYADDLDPQWVTALLGVQPSFAASKGDRRPSGSHEVVQRVGMWQFGLPGTKEWILEDAIRTLLSRLPSDPAVWEQLSQRARTDVFCGLFLRQWNRGVDLTSQLLAELSARRLGLSLDIYGEGEED
jgi:hypothetical protein